MGTENGRIENGTRPEGAHIGVYRIDGLLGQGGMGEVFLAWDERLRRHVALKRIRSDKPPNDDTRRRFRREARAVARLSHPAIIQIFDILETAEGDCIVMEYVRGQGLRELIASGSLDTREALRLGRQIAEGLGHAHGKGLVHRDLKPENVLVVSEGHPAPDHAAPGRAAPGRSRPDRAAPGRAKILDFGLARSLWEDAPEAGDESDLTASGALVGTTHAMSPEQASGRAVDHRADLFALGGLLYQMLSGRPPFPGRNLLDTLRRINSEDPEPLHELCPDLPRPVITLVETLMAKDPQGRPANARWVARQLEELLSGTADTVSVAPARAPARKPPASTDLEDPPTAAPLHPSEEIDRGSSAIRVLVLTDLVDSTRLVERLGDARAAELAARHDRMARDLLARYDGLEIDKTDGFLLLFERPGDAVSYALAYHQALDQMAQAEKVALASRVGIHLGEVFLRKNPDSDVARGAKPLEVEGLAKPTAARLMSLGNARQTLLTRGVFDLARRSAVAGPLADPRLRWLTYGEYSFQGVEKPLEVCEVGLRGFAALAAPTGSEKAWRLASSSEELMLGWRPAVGQEVARRPQWELTERIGEGGFGEVWLAEHKSGERRVFKFCFEPERLRSLKREVTLFRLLKSGLGDRDDIARLVGWSFEEAPYYLEAEYTAGGNLRGWAEEQGGIDAVPLPTRLGIGAQVADALAAAHSMGVLHKDVKPENVLIRLDVSGEPRIRLTDFGIGRLTDASRLEGQGFTVQGLTAGEETHSVSGTPLYMAPELLEGKPESVQADVYSLGVLLYQMIIGDFSRALAPGWQRQIDDELLVRDLATWVDGSPRHRPASTAEVAEKLRTLEDRRAAVAAEKEAAAQAERMQRNHERMLRRRKVLSWVVAAGAVVLTVLSIFAVQAERARKEAERAREAADRNRGRAEDLIGFMLGDLRKKLEPVGRLDVLDDVSNKALEYFADLAEGEVTPQILSQRAKALRQIGEVRRRAGDLEAAERAFLQSLEQLKALIDLQGPEDALRADLADTRFWLGYVLWERSDFEGALLAYEEHRAIYADLVEKDPRNSDWRLELAYGYMNVGDALLKLGRAEESLEAHSSGLEIVKSLSSAEPSRLDLLLEVAAGHRRLGRSMLRLGKHEEALKQHRMELSLVEGLIRRDPENTKWRQKAAATYTGIASAMRYVGELAGALESYSRAEAIYLQLVARDAENAFWQVGLSNTHVNMGDVLGLAGDHRGALASYQKALAIAVKWSGRKPGDVGWRKRLAQIHFLTGRSFLETRELDRALEETRSCLGILEALVPDEAVAGPDLGLSQGYSLLGDVLAQKDDPVGAQVARGKALAAIEPLARDSLDLDLLEQWLRALLALERRKEAQTVAERMRGLGALRFNVLDFLEEHGL